MNKKLLFFVLATFLLSIPTFAFNELLYNENETGLGAMHTKNPPVHQYISYQAYLNLPDSNLKTEMGNYIGSKDECINNNCGVEDSGTKVCEGAFEEDQIGVWMNHFWDPKNGENAGLPGYDSAYKRAKTLWDTQVIPNYPSNKAKSYYYLGRVAHLLEDTSVPAHVHRDCHWELGCGDDSYEDYIPSHYTEYTSTGTIIKKTSLLDLFYNLAEKANDYDSDDYKGEIDKGNRRIDCNLFGYCDISDANCKIIGDTLMPEAINHVSGLYRLFWLETHPNTQCQSGKCCDISLGLFKGYGKQPTGVNDYYFTTGKNNPADTSNIMFRDYYCSGTSNNEDYLEYIYETCGPCKYAKDGSNVCSNYDTSTLYNSIKKCSSGTGAGKYGDGGMYLCQGFCDGKGSIGYAGNCTYSNTCGMPGYNNHYYNLILAPNGINWTESKKNAEKESYLNFSGHLATITSNEENNFIANLLKGNVVSAWIGGFQPEGSPEPSGGWKWLNNEPWLFSNWGTGNPSNSNGKENVIHVYAEDTWNSKKWNDLPDSEILFGYLIEFNANCSNSTDCGTNGFAGNNFCSGNNVTRNFIKFSCAFPGTADSYCTNSTTINMIENCTKNQICSDGKCICVTNLTNTSWSEWINVSCLKNDKMNQTRNRIQYDSNNCGSVQNKTIYEYQAILKCDYCQPNVTNTTWSYWQNQTACLIKDYYVQNRSRIEYDSNYSTCYLVTLNETDLWNNWNNKTNWDYINKTCNYCSYSVKNISTRWEDYSCLITDVTKQKRANITYDENYETCYAITKNKTDLWNNGENITVIEFKELEPGSCNNCSSDIQGPFYTDWSECSIYRTSNRTKYYIDRNYETCCKVTGLASDCEVNTTYKNATESSGDCPFMKLFTPKGGKIYSNRKINVDFVANETYDKIDFTDLTNIPLRWSNLCTNCNSSNKTRTFTNEEHVLVFRGISGNKVEFFNLTSFLVDSKYPQISRVLPRSNSFTNGSGFYVKYTEENLKNISITYNPTEVIEECNKSGKNQECWFNLNLTQFDSREIEYSIKITDVAENREESKKTKVKVDTTPPVINSQAISGIYLKVNVTEANLDVVEYKDLKDPRARWKTACTRLKDGMCEKRIGIQTNPHIQIRVLDKAGNSAFGEIK